MMSYRKTLMIAAMVLILGVAVMPAFAQAMSYSSSPGIAISNAAVARNSISVSDSTVIQVLKVSVDITHSHGGDLQIFLEHSGGKRITLMNSLNGPGFAFGCGADAINVTFDDNAARVIDSFDCSGNFEMPATGVYKPSNALSTFAGMSGAGTWTIEVRDSVVNDNGVLNRWSITINDFTPPPPAELFLGGGINDGRINNRAVDIAAPVAIYCDYGGDIKVYDIVNERTGVIAFFVLGKDILATPQNPPAAIKLGEGKGASMYQTPEGELQVNAAGLPGEEGKIYEFRWVRSRCPISIDQPGNVKYVGVTHPGETSTSPGQGEQPPLVDTNLVVDGNNLDGYAIVNMEKLSMRSGAGIQYTVVAVLDGGTTLVVEGVNRDRTWWFVRAGVLRGWVQNDLIIIRGDLGNVPLMESEGDVLPARFILFADNTVYLSPSTSSVGLCVISGNQEYIIVGRTAAVDWYQINYSCGEAQGTGWVKADLGSVRAVAGQHIPVTE